MKRTCTHRIVAVAITVAIPAVAAAQPAPPEALRRVQTLLPERQPGATLEFIGAEIPLGPIVKGAPFSGEGVTTMTQTLGDGTRINRTTTARLYRDSDGRVRREQTVLGLGVLASGDDPQVVTILDPVSGVSYVIDAHTRTAHRSRLPQAVARRMAGSDVGAIPPPPPPPPPPPGEPRARRPANVANMPESLGTKQIEGVTAAGSRRTETIPAGRIGNDRPIVVTDERWESPDLKVLMISEHHDPRTGDVEYRLTNVSRAEPPRDLFTVPQDYTIVDAPPPPPPPPTPRGPDSLQ